MPTRRHLLACGAALALPVRAAPGDALVRALRGAQAGGGVLMLRHALAPGTFDPPGFRLGDCATQRNLDDEGRRQARHLGAWCAAHKLRPTRVRSSPWCRCLETATLAFGDRAEPWAALGSPRAGDEAGNAQALAQLHAGLASVVTRRTGLEVWVTHMFVFSALLGEGAGVGEGALLGLGDGGAPRVIARLTGLPG
ncbi:MAG: histidine phosphatase family protein [Burkholderiales bacterium]|nr:histidine phosphatase family protein [Burkholderiales bacterium]